MNLVLLGPSGAGKGTQAKFLSNYYKVPHISTGDILRGHIARKTDIGLKTEHIMDTGKLVPDEIVIDLVKERLKEPDCINGFILDGFPRNLHQAKVLCDMSVGIDRVICIRLNDEIIIKRMSGRYTCLNCGAVYHIDYYPPKMPELCDVCNTKLIQRDDDKESTVVNRLNIYHKMTEPIITYFNDIGIITEIDGSNSAEKISDNIINLLQTA